MRIRSSEGNVLFANESFDPVADEARPAEIHEHDESRLSRFASAAFDPNDAIARTARSMRMSIAATLTFDGQPVRSVAVVSMDAAFEASVLAANLAISYAQSGVSTVLVDANLHDARQHELLGVARDVGLAEVLGGDADAQMAVEPSPVRDLFVLPAGQSRPDAQILYDGDRFHRRAMTLLDSFSMMVVDVGVTFEDPPAFCEALDAVVLIVRRDATPIAAIQHLVGRFGDMKTRVVGTLVAD